MHDTTATERPRIEDYALIGGGRTAALVSRDGSVDWLCWPRLDAPACFAALLGDVENGTWFLGPAGPAETTRGYEPGSTVLRTEHRTEGGRVRVTDFMPPPGKRDALVRLVEGLEGTVEMRLLLALRPDYGRTIPWVERLDRGAGGPFRWRAVAGPNLFVLTSPIDLQGVGMRTEGAFAVRAGARLAFELAHGPSHADLPAPADGWAELEACRAHWRRFAARGRPLPGLPAEWQAAVDRSAVTLKALTYAATGGIAAAATTSLPEHLGGTRNWDYRFCWLRDAAFTLDALMACGHEAEAGAWRDWLMRAVAGAPEQLQIMYGLAGERILTEWEVPWLSGHRGSVPVRVGNAAADQFQLDVYGEVADALFEARRRGLPEHPRAAALRPEILRCLERQWREPDEGIWEVRGERRHFTHSKVMAWAAFDRAARRAEKGGAEGCEWRALADAVRAEVEARAWDARASTFTQAYDSEEVDASLLLMPLYGFLPADDPRVEGTVRAVEARLGRGGLLLRYDGEDGLAPGEGAFLLCSFWMVEVMALQGRLDEARALFARLLDLRNDVGLLAEEAEPKTGRQLGNFPQAFSHVGVINAAAALSRAGAA